MLVLRLLRRCAAHWTWSCRNLLLPPGNALRLCCIEHCPSCILKLIGWLPEAGGELGLRTRLSDRTNVRTAQAPRLLPSKTEILEQAPEAEISTKHAEPTSGEENSAKWAKLHGEALQWDRVDVLSDLVSCMGRICAWLVGQLSDSVTTV